MSSTFVRRESHFTVCFTVNYMVIHSSLWRHICQNHPFVEMCIKSNIFNKSRQTLWECLSHEADDSPLSWSMKHTLPWALKASVSGVTQSVWKSGERAMLCREHTHSTHTAHSSCSDSPLSLRHKISARETFSWGNIEWLIACMHDVETRAVQWGWNISLI